jgi:hypothetical protein
MRRHVTDRHKGNKNLSSSGEKSNKKKIECTSKSQKKKDNSNSKNKKVGYLDAIADQEANLISITGLQEGEDFEKHINNIINIIEGVEKNMS